MISGNISANSSLREAVTSPTTQGFRPDDRVCRPFSHHVPSLGSSHLIESLKMSDSRQVTSISSCNMFPHNPHHVRVPGNNRQPLCPAWWRIMRKVLLPNRKHGAEAQGCSERLSFWIQQHVIQGIGRLLHINLRQCTPTYSYSLAASNTEPRTFDLTRRKD